MLQSVAVHLVAAWRLVDRFSHIGFNNIKRLSNPLAYPAVLAPQDLLRSPPPSSTSVTAANIWKTNTSEQTHYLYSSFDTVNSAVVSSLPVPKDQIAIDLRPDSQTERTLIRTYSSCFNACSGSLQQILAYSTQKHKNGSGQALDLCLQDK
jgi:hypothetical protein